MNNENIALPNGTMIESFEIRRVIGTGGFGVTYLGFDQALERRVAIKEYCPHGIANRVQDDTTLVPASSGDKDMFSYGLNRFLDEARTLARFHHPSIVHVHRFLEANGTGYLVMDYEQGPSLSELLRRQDTLGEEQLLGMLLRLLEGLEVVHNQKYLHRDIKPGNIIVRSQAGPVLLDFGAARQALEQQGGALTVMLTPGYAPIEQYSSTDKQGPWSDLYALGATCYHCMIGEPPINATDRVAGFIEPGDSDPVRDRLDAAAGTYSDRLVEAVKWMLEAVPALRPQHTGEALGALKRSARPATPREQPTIVESPYADFEKSPQLAAGLEAALEKSGVGVALRVVRPAMATASTYRGLVDYLAGYILDDARQSVFVQHALGLPAIVQSSGDATGPAVPSTYRAPDAPSSDSIDAVADDATFPGAERDTAGPPATESVRDDVIAHAERRLARLVGPIASILVEEAAGRANTRDEFYQLLANELDSVQEREAFLKGLR